MAFSADAENSVRQTIMERWCALTAVQVAPDEYYLPALISSAGVRPQTLSFTAV